MKNLKHTISAVLLLLVGTITAQQTPADKQSETISIVGATAHIGNGKVINNSIIVFENGKLTTVAAANASAQKGKIIDAKGKHVYPGFILPNSTLGLGEIDAVKASLDFDEIGDIIPHVRSIIAYNAESKVIESVRPNGILLAQTTPRGGRISGTSSIVQLDAWNWEDAIVKENDGIHLNWPNSFSQGRWWLGEDSSFKPNKNYAKSIEKLSNFIQEATAYLKGNSTRKNLPYEAVAGLFNGNQKLYIHANGAQEITDGIAFAVNANIKNIVIVGGYDAHKIMPLLKKHNVSVLLLKTHTNPNSEDEDYDLPYKLPVILSQNGILVGLENSGGMERMKSRNLPFYAGTAVAHGLSKEDALKLITSNTAKILGIDSTYGTLEVGKSATLFISEGDALDMKTNLISKAFIDGRAISLETHQTKLWKRYSKKYSKK